MPDGPDYDALFRGGMLQPGNPDIPEHAEIVTRFLRGLKGTAEFQGLFDAYVAKGYKAVEDLIDKPKKIKKEEPKEATPPATDDKPE